jgi:hypothetical protein
MESGLGKSALEELLIFEYRYPPFLLIDRRSLGSSYLDGLFYSGFLKM